MSLHTIHNGVRQGGILSPSLFTIYTDDLSSLFIITRIGCHSDEGSNHVIYVHDVCLIILSTKYLTSATFMEIKSTLIEISFTEMSPLISNVKLHYHLGVIMMMKLIMMSLLLWKTFNKVKI